MNNITEGKKSTLYHFKDEIMGMSRDYTFVGDVVNANQLSLNNGNGQIYNIGTGSATTTGELYNIILEAVTNIAPDISADLSTPNLGPARPGDIKRSCLKVEKVYEELKFRGADGTKRWH